MKFKLLLITLSLITGTGVGLAFGLARCGKYQQGYDSAISDISNGRVASLPPTHDLGALSKSYEAGQRDAEENTAKCTLKLAHAGRCWIPCNEAADCVAKNGRERVQQ